MAVTGMREKGGNRMVIEKSVKRNGRAWKE